MGLDMYLTRKKYVGANFEHRKVEGNISIKIGDKELPINFNKVIYIEEEGLYWRKANAIHNWFVQNVQEGVDDCKEYYVEKSQLEELLEVCKQLRDSLDLDEEEREIEVFSPELGMHKEKEKVRIIKNPDICDELLPSKAGFFFGDTEYDEWYLRDLEYTIEELSKILEEENKLNEEHIYSDFYYRASW